MSVRKFTYLLLLLSVSVSFSFCFKNKKVKTATIFIERSGKDTIRYEYYDEIIDMLDTSLHEYYEYDVEGKLLLKLIFNKNGDTISVKKNDIKEGHLVEKKQNVTNSRNNKIKYDSLGRKIEDRTFLPFLNMETIETFEWYKNNIQKSKHTKEYMKSTLINNVIDYFDVLGNRVKTIDSLNKRIYEAKFDDKNNVIEQSFYNFEHKLTYRWQGKYDKYNNLIYQKMTEEDGSTRENRFINKYTFYEK